MIEADGRVVQAPTGVSSPIGAVHGPGSGLAERARGLDAQATGHRGDALALYERLRCAERRGAPRRQRRAA